MRNLWRNSYEFSEFSAVLWRGSPSPKRDICSIGQVGGIRHKKSEGSLIKGELYVGVKDIRIFCTNKYRKNS